MSKKAPEPTFRAASRGVISALHSVQSIALDAGMMKTYRAIAESLVAAGWETTEILDRDYPTTHPIQSD